MLGHEMESGILIIWTHDNLAKTKIKILLLNCEGSHENFMLGDNFAASGSRWITMRDANNGFWIVLTNCPGNIRKPVHELKLK